MPAITITDHTKTLNDARSAEPQAHLVMLAAFARLQLDVQATHNADWTVVSVRSLENSIDGFKVACQNFCKAKDAVIKALALGGDRFDSSVPSPNNLSGPTPPGWTTEFQDGIPVLVPDAGTPSPTE